MIATVAGIECKGVGSVQLASVAEELQAEDTAKALAQKESDAAVQRGAEFYGSWPAIR